jgi:hypothetical protein
MLDDGDLGCLGGDPLLLGLRGLAHPLGAGVLACSGLGLSEPPLRCERVAPGDSSGDLFALPDTLDSRALRASSEASGSLMAIPRSDGQSATRMPVAYRR